MYTKAEKLSRTALLLTAMSVLGFGFGPPIYQAFTQQLKQRADFKDESWESAADKDTANWIKAGAPVNRPIIISKEK